MVSKAHPFSVDFADLPESLPIFPLSGCVLLPLGQLQLNIFEPRYVSMVLDALRAQRLLGIVQPDPSQDIENALYRTGCAGRISAFSETADGRLLINLSGVCRFDCLREIEGRSGYRCFAVDWSRFAADMREHEARVDTDHLFAILDGFFRQNEIQADMDALRQMSSAVLINSLATNLPFEPIDKQSLVEAPNLADRTDILIALARMSLNGFSQNSGLRH